MENDAASYFGQQRQKRRIQNLVASSVPNTLGDIEKKNRNTFAQPRVTDGH